MTKYRWIRARKAEGFPIRLCCRVAEVPPSSYYDWRETHGSGPTAFELDEAYLVNEIIAIHDTLDDTYGSPRLTGELRRERCVNHKRVERIVRENGLYAKDARRKKCRTTIPDVSAPPLPDHINRDFSVGEPGLRTCGDITYIPTGEGWLFLAGVLDIGSRRCVGYDMGERMPTELVSNALTMAVNARGGDVKGMVFHGDRGAQGEFNRSSQHLDHGGGNGKASRMDERTDGASTDEVARSAGSSQRSRKRVLARGSHRDHERSSGSGCRCVSSGRHTLVPASWWNAIESSCTTNRSVFVVQRARGDRDP